MDAAGNASVGDDNPSVDEKMNDLRAAGYGNDFGRLGFGLGRPIIIFEPEFNSSKTIFKVSRVRFRPGNRQLIITHDQIKSPVNPDLPKSSQK